MQNHYARDWCFNDLFSIQFAQKLFSSVYMWENNFQWWCSHLHPPQNRPPPSPIIRYIVCYLKRRVVWCSQTRISLCIYNITNRYVAECEKMWKIENKVCKKLHIAPTILMASNSLLRWSPSYIFVIVFFIILIQKKRV